MFQRNSVVYKKTVLVKPVIEYYKTKFEVGSLLEKLFFYLCPFYGTLEHYGTFMGHVRQKGH